MTIYGAQLTSALCHRPSLTFRIAPFLSLQWSRYDYAAWSVSSPMQPTAWTSRRHPLSGALLTPQGKVLADFLAIRTPDGVLLDAAEAHIDDLAKRLKMFRLRSQVEIERLENVFRGRRIRGGARRCASDIRRPARLSRSTLSWRSLARTCDKRELGGLVWVSSCRMVTAPE